MVVDPDQPSSDTNPPTQMIPSADPDSQPEPKRSTRDSVHSLSSSRPAPPSPTSQSRTSSRPSSRPSSQRSDAPEPLFAISSVSSMSSRNPPQKRQSKLQHEIMQNSEPPDSEPVPKPEQEPTEEETDPLPPWPPIKIRDFGFPPADNRHIGSGPDVPIHNNYRKYPSSTSGSTNKSAQEDFDDDDEDEDDDFDFDFDDDEIEQAEEESVLQPGKYRALYAFVPEGAAEMALEEGQIIQVIGRGGGGAGWAVVDKDDGSGQALVPESYLEFVE